MKEKILKKIKSLEWQDWVFIALVLAFFIIHLSIVMQYKQLPNPLYGGDYYYHYGHIQHLRSGGSVFESSHYYNEYEHYAWLLPLIIAKASALLNASLLKTTLFFQALLSLVAGIIGYFLGLRIFKDKSMALFFGFAWMSSRIIQATASGFSYLILIPLGVLAIYYAENWKDRITAGIVFGIAGIGNIVAFTALTLFMALVFAYRILEKHFSFADMKLSIMHIHNFFRTIKNEILFFLPIFTIGFVIALLYLWPIIFVYRAVQPNPWQDYVLWGKEGIWTYIWALIKGTFFDFSTPALGILTVLMLYGLLVLFVRLRKGEKQWMPILFMLLTTAVGVIHPLITEPLFGKSLGYYGISTTIYLARVMLISLGVYSVFMIIQEKSESKKVFGKEHAFLAVAILVLIYFSATVFAGMRSNIASNDVVVAMQDEAQWIKDNTNVDDVFLSTHGETGFALNALTGRKIVHMRRTHASSFVDANERIADAAVMLYGNDDLKRKELIDKYKVKYVYEDLQSQRAMQACLENWNNFDRREYQDVSYNCLQTSPKYNEYLQKYGIETKNVYVRLDVAFDEAPRFDMIAVKPNGIKLNMTPVKEIKVTGGLIGVMYKVN